MHTAQFQEKFGKFMDVTGQFSTNLDICLGTAVQNVPMECKSILKLGTKHMPNCMQKHRIVNKYSSATVIQITKVSGNVKYMKRWK